MSRFFPASKTVDQAKKTGIYLITIDEPPYVLCILTRIHACYLVIDACYVVKWVIFSGVEREFIEKVEKPKNRESHFWDYH